MLQNPGLTRRGLLMLAGGAVLQPSFRLYAFGSNFWDKKEPAEWSSEEIDRLVTKSPWAKQVNAASSAMSRTYAPNTNDPGVGPSSGGYPNPGGGYPGGG